MHSSPGQRADGKRPGQPQAQNAEVAGDLALAAARDAWNACRLTRTISRRVAWSRGSRRRECRPAQTVARAGLLQQDYRSSGYLFGGSQPGAGPSLAGKRFHPGALLRAMPTPWACPYRPDQERTVGPLPAAATPPARTTGPIATANSTITPTA